MSCWETRVLRRWKREERKGSDERCTCMREQAETKNEPEPRLRRAVGLLLRLRASLSM